MREIFYGKESAGPGYFRRPGCQFAAYSARSPGRDTANEDCAGWIGLSRDSWVFVIADGLGELPAGNACSQLAVTTILDQLSRKSSIDDVRSAILAGIDRANTAILESGTGGATTLIVVELDKGAIRTYHIGNTMTLVTGQRGQLMFETVPHSPAAHPPAGWIKESELSDTTDASIHQDRNHAVNILGSEEMRLEMGPRIILSNFDTVILASHGLLDNLSRQTVIDTIKSGPLDARLAQLSVECRETMISDSGSIVGHPDDLTMILLRRSE